MKEIEDRFLKALVSAEGLHPTALDYIQAFIKVIRGTSVSHASTVGDRDEDMRWKKRVRSLPPHSTSFLFRSCFTTCFAPPLYSSSHILEYSTIRSCARKNGKRTKLTSFKFVDFCYSSSSSCRPAFPACPPDPGLWSQGSNQWKETMCKSKRPPVVDFEASF